MKPNTRCGKVVASALLLASVLIAGNKAFADDAPLRVAVESHGADLVEVILTNVGDESLSVLSWGTPFETVISHDIFDIHIVNESTQTNLTYKGRSVKRGDPMPEDFIDLAAGESVQQFLSLSVYYAIPEQGVYTLEYNGSIVFRSTDDASRSSGQSSDDVDRQIKSVALIDAAGNQHRSAQLASASITLELIPPPQTRAARVPAYFSCSAAQRTELATALQASEEIVNVARDDLSSLFGDARLNSPRYQNWFGDYSAARFQAVLDTFNAASNIMANEQIEFDCSCDEAGLFAYVFPSDPYRVYPCPNFWAASLNGTDSRAGTILHELTHFPAINGTDDFEYGTTPVAQLATTNPEQAVNNADSYEYFAENTPNLAISNLLVFTDMAVGVSEFSELRVGESSFYKVVGADYILLTSTTGDADLYVYETASNQNITCRSLSADGVDRCDLNSSATAYIEVRGHMASQFSVVAQVNAPSEPAPEPTQEPEPQLDNPIVTTEAGDDVTSGGNGGEATAEDSGGGAAGLSLMLLLVCRRFRCCVPGVSVKDVQ